MSYSGAHTLEELQEKAIFVRMTGAGLKESGPHDVEVVGVGPYALGEAVEIIARSMRPCYNEMYT